MVPGKAAVVMVGAAAELGNSEFDTLQPDMASAQSNVAQPQHRLCRELLGGTLRIECRTSPRMGALRIAGNRRSGGQLP